MGRFIAVFVVALCLSCSDTAQDCTVNKKCSDETGGASSGSGGGGTDNGGAGGMGNEGGQGGAGGHGPACDDVDPTASPADDTCVIDEAFGVFVSPDGDDEAGDGTQGSPFATLTKAIAAAAEQDKNVYACATSGDYTEALRLDENAAGVALFGGFDCDTWAYDTETKARIAPGDPHAVVAASADGLELHDLEIVADDATTTGGSSIALFVSESENVVLERVRLVAGVGLDGVKPVLADVQYEYPDVADLRGNAADGVTGADRKTCTCDSGDTSGGNGGDAPLSGGGQGLPDLGGGAPGVVGACAPVDSAGQPNPPLGIDGTGAAAYGTLAADGWTPEPGTAGVDGTPGQGGGGGASDSLGGGGGGGCGGCGGKGAPASTGGGSSIALLLFEATVTVTASELVATDAGDGGDAQSGQEGQTEGGNGGAAGLDGGCQGGKGGPGGNGGASGAGAGGLSVGILYSGTEPTLDESTSNAITTGTAGNGGSAVTGKGDTAGRGGVAQATLEVS